MPAFMKSKNLSNRWYYTTEFSRETITEQKRATRVKQMLGFGATICEATTIREELARVDAARAWLDSQSASQPEIVAALQAELADEFRAEEFDISSDGDETVEEVVSDLVDALDTDFDGVAKVLRTRLGEMAPNLAAQLVPAAPED